MRRYREIILVLTLILFSIFLSITLVEPLVAYGQAKGKNPFFLPPGVYLLSKKGGPLVKKEKAPKLETKLPEHPPAPWKVKAILISEHIRLVSIGQQIVAIGDAINDERILEIEPDRVILGKGDKRRTLFLPQIPLLLTVEKEK
ncbi:MAG: hypothetical protein HY882_15630 [Deltaproteobacteria bacterium]|nr:hypothetical protein [Deltaproteobacteria bacterium]